MKKFFSFVAASAMMLATGSALADTVVIYSWEGGSEAATESGGTVVANGANTAIAASRITVSAKKAAIADDNVTITLENALAEGDVIAITGYRDKDETTDGNGNLLESPTEKVGNLYIAFGTGTAIDEGSNNVWNNINANAIGGAKEANTNTYTITDQAGSKQIQLARSKASTNVFITKLLITREVTAPFSPVDCTASVDVNGWKSEMSGNGVGNYTKDVAQKEHYNGATTALLGDVLYQTVEGLANGTYTVELYANASYTSGRGFTSAALNGELGRAIVYAGDVEKTIPVVHQTAVGTNNIVTLENVVVSDGTLKMGLRKDVEGSNWHTIQIKSLTQTSDKAEADAAAQDEYWKGIAATVAAYEAYANVAGAEKAAIAAAETKAAAQAAIAPFYAAKDAYDALVQAIADASAAGVDATDAKAVLASAETTAAAATEALHLVKLAVNTSKATEGADMTSAITNPSFENGTTGWTYETSNDHGAKENSNATYTMTNCDGNYLFNIWSSGNAISQKVEDLPNGTYILTATIATDGGQKVQLNANDKSIQIDATDKGTGVEGQVEFNVLDNTATIGAEGVNKYWYKVDNFRLTFVKGFDMEGLTTAYNNALAEAQAVTGNMNAEVATALAAAIAAEVDKTNGDALAAATTALTEATSAAKASATAYASASEKLAAMKEFVDATNLYTAEALATYYTQWTEKLAAKTLTTDEANALQDPNTVTGWRASNTVDDLIMSVWDETVENWNSYHVNTWSTEGNTDGSEFKVPFIEYWTGDDGSLGEKTLTATLNGVAAGNYAVSAWVRVRIKNGAEAPASGITFQANDGEAVNVADGAQIGTSQFYLKEVTAEGTVGEDGVLTVKFNVAADNNISWLSFKNVKFEEVVPAAEDIELTLESGKDIATELAAAIEGKKVGNITINLAEGGSYTISASIVAPASVTINGNGATVDASALAANFIEMAVVETPTEWTEANVTIKGVTVKGLAKALFYSACKNYFGDVTVDNCVVELAADATTFDYTKGSTAVNFSVTNSTFYAPTATTKSLYSSQGGQKATEYKEDATQTFTFTNNTMYNLASGKNFFTHRQSNQKWLAYTVQNNIFVNCGKSGQVIKGMNGGQNGANPTWNISGNVFNFDGTDTSASEDTGDTTEGEGVQNSVAGVVTFADAANGDFNAELGVATVPAEPTVVVGDPRWTVTAAQVPVDIVISPAEGDIAAALATASEGKLVKNITINLTNDVTYTISASIVAPASLTINGNGATVDASALAANFIEMAVVETPTEWTEANVTIKGVTVKGLTKALFYSACKNYFGDVIVDKCVVELAADATTFDYTKGSTAVNFTVTNSTFYAPTATTKSLYSSQSGQKTTEYKEDATQTFTFTNNTMYNLASGKNFFTHRQSNQTWLAYTVQNNIFVNCGKSGQVIKGMNGGQNGANPTWNISGNVFNFDGADTSASEDTGDTTEGEGVQNSIAGIVTFADAAAGDFNGTFAYPFGTTAPESVGGDARWTITIAEGEDVSGIETLSVAGEQGDIFNLNGVKAVKADGMSIVNGKVVFIKK